MRGSAWSRKLPLLELRGGNRDGTQRWGMSVCLFASVPAYMRTWVHPVRSPGYVIQWQWGAEYGNVSGEATRSCSAAEDVPQHFANVRESQRFFYMVNVSLLGEAINVQSQTLRDCCAHSSHRGVEDSADGLTAPPNFQTGEGASRMHHCDLNWMENLNYIFFPTIKSNK